MIPLKQKYRHDPRRRIYGDCHRAALASIFELELDDVPHFADGWPSGRTFTARVQAWLAPRNLTSMDVPYTGSLEDVLSALRGTCRGSYILFAGISRSGVAHIVVVKDGEIVHDPSLDRLGPLQPTDDGYFWVTFLVPIRPELCLPMIRAPQPERRWPSLLQRLREWFHAAQTASQ